MRPRSSPLSSFLTTCARSTTSAPYSAHQTLSAWKRFISAASQPLHPHPEIHKTALGGEDSVDWRYFPTATEAVAELQKEGVFVYSIEQVEGSTKLQNLSLDTDRRYAVVFGNEVKGVHQEVVDLADGCLEIPQFGTKHSLNVSVTAGIVIWEVAKQFIAGSSYEF